MQRIVQFGDGDQLGKRLEDGASNQFFWDATPTLVDRDDHAIDDVQNAVVGGIVDRRDGTAVRRYNIPIL